MKKFLLTMFVLGLLVFAAIAAVPVLIRVVGPDMMPESVPPKGVPFGYREFPIPERSLLAVKLDLPIETLREMANRDIPKQITGSERQDLHKKIKDATIQWRMLPGNLTLQNTGSNLTYKLPLEGNANANGHFGLFKIGIKGNCSMSGSISGNFSPIIDSNWQVTPNLTHSLNITKAVANYGRQGPRDAKAEVEQALRPKINAELAKIGPALTGTLNMKEGVQNMWNKAHLVKLMTKDPDAWLVFDPAMAQMGPIDYSNTESVSITIGMVAQTFITNAEVRDRIAERVPYLNIVPENPVTDLRVPIIANLKALNSSLADDQFMVTTDSGIKIQVTRPGIELAEEGKLNVTLDIKTLTGVMGKGVSATVKLNARPIVDCETQSFGFTDVKMTLQTREFISRSAAWLLEGMLIKAIEKELRIDLNDHLPKVENELFKVINSAKVPEHLELCFENPEVELLGVYTVERNSWNEELNPGIVFVFGAKGDISVKLAKL